MSEWRQVNFCHLLKMKHPGISGIIKYGKKACEKEQKQAG